VREKAARDGQYVVKYLTTTSLRDGDDAVIGDGSRFIVHSVDRSKKIPVVYMVEDAYAADRVPATV
jgi:predicted transcriptional regulator